jgi:hypothetical protein
MSVVYESHPSVASLAYPGVEKSGRRRSGFVDLNDPFTPHQARFLATARNLAWCAERESNPRYGFGRPEFYH